jgi:hypothetical protein
LGRAKPTSVLGPAAWNYELLITDATFPFMDLQACTLVPPQFGSPVPHDEPKETAMKKLLAAALIAGSFISVEAKAQSRAGDAALGAVSGAVVLGPVGAVAGAFIGYTAGPSIARSWGVGRSASRSQARSTNQPSLAKSDPRSSKQNSNNHSGVTQSASIQGIREPSGAKVGSPPPIKSPETLPGKGAAPTVQGFE